MNSADLDTVRQSAERWDRIETWAFLVVVVALAVEFAAHKFGAPYKKKLEEAADIMLADGNARAAEAKAISSKAQQASAEAAANLAQANARAAEAQKTAESFRLDIATANERAAAAQADAARFNEIAERERLARLTLEEKLRPRSLTSSQRSSIARALSSSAGITVDIIRVGDGMEISSFATVFSEVIRAGSWEVRGVWSSMGGLSATGVVVSLPVGASARAQSAANLLLDQMHSAGIDCSSGPTFSGPNDLPSGLTGPNWLNTAPSIRVYIGEKP